MHAEPSAEALSEEELLDFVSKWALDSRAEESLRRMDGTAQARVVQGFNPPDVSQASKVFMGFAKSVIASSPTTNTAIDAFVKGWGLDTTSHDALFRLDPDAQ